MAYKQISPQVVAEGGTGVSSNTAYAVLTGGTTATGAIQSIASVGSSGQVLTSNGAAALPTFQAAAGDVSGPGSSTDNALARWNGTGGDTLQDSTVIVSDNGEMTNASQPAFLAYLPSTDANASGDGTVYTLGATTALTEVFDQNSDFNTNGTFTAPVTGRYRLSSFIIASTGTDITGSTIQLVTSNRSYRVDGANGPSAVTNTNNYINELTDMDAADTCTVTIQLVDTGGKIDDIIGAASPMRSRFSGYLVC